MMSLWDALRMNMMISYQELVRTFLSTPHIFFCRYMLSCVRLLTLLSIIRTASTPKGALGHAIVWLASFIASPVLLPATESGEAGVVQSLHTQLTGVGLRIGSFLLP